MTSRKKRLMKEFAAAEVGLKDDQLWKRQPGQDYERAKLYHSHQGHNIEPSIANVKLR